MPLKPHPTDPDKMVYVKREYILPKEWVGLTEEEHTELAIECGCLSIDWVFYGAAVEAKLKEKNGNKFICD